MSSHRTPNASRVLLSILIVKFVLPVTAFVMELTFLSQLAYRILFRIIKNGLEKHNAFQRAFSVPFTSCKITFQVC